MSSRNVEFQPHWTTQIDGKFTFAGVLTTYWDQVKEFWRAESTQKHYINDYERYILPELETCSLEACLREDFDRIVEKLPLKKAEEGLVCNDTTIRHMRHIMRRVLKVAAENNICDDVLWGTEYDVSESQEDAELFKDEYVKLRKSLTIQEEIHVAKAVLTDPEQPSESFGLALMFCLGLRNNEACGADFGDIHPFGCDPSQSALWVYKSTEKGTNIQRYSGKTRNVSRIIPLPASLQDLLEKRRAFLERRATESSSSSDLSQEQVKAEVDAMPIVGLGNSFRERCSAPILTKAGTALLRKAQLEQEMLSLIDRDIRKPGRTEEGIAEKDPTAYLFRRNLGTHLYLLGLEESEIQYILGHDIEDDNDERSFFRNEEKLYPIAKKMALRPIVNPIIDTPETPIDGPAYYHHDTCKERLLIPIVGSVRYHVVIRQREPNSGLKVRCDAKNARLQATCVEHPNVDPYSETISITHIYQSAYKDKGF